MADGDYERGRGREIAAIAAELRRLAAGRTSATCETPVAPVLVLNGWSASPRAWDLCRFPRERVFSYVDQLDGLPEARISSAAPGERFVLVGWSMGGSSALRLACRFPGRVAALVLVAATPRMMEDKATGWRGMSPRRLAALEYGLKATRGEGFFGAPEGRPNPYMMDSDENLARGLDYLRETDLRDELARARLACPARILQSERDGIVRADNARFLGSVIADSAVEMVPGAEHALPVTAPERIDAAVMHFLGAKTTELLLKAEDSRLEGGET